MALALMRIARLNQKILPGQPDRRACGRGNAFLTSGKSEPLARGRLHGDARLRKPGDLGDLRTHRIAQWTDFRRFANHRHFQMCDPSATFADEFDRMFQELIGRSTLPLRIARREVRTDVAIGQRAEDGVDNRMQSDVAIGMREEAAIERHTDAAQHQVIAVGQRMHVVAGAGADIAQHGAEARFLACKVFRGGQLHVRSIAFKGRNRQSCPFGNCSVVGKIIAAFTRGTAMGFQNNVETERLRRLRDS